MRIALINSVAGYGSTGRIVDQLAHLPETQARIYYGRKHKLQELECLFVCSGSSNNDDVHTANLINLIVVDLRVIARWIL